MTPLTLATRLATLPVWAAREGAQAVGARTDCAQAAFRSRSVHAIASEPLADTPAGVVPPKKAIEFDYPFSQTLRFVEVAEEVKDSGLKIEDLEYLLRHRFDETGKYRPNRERHAGLAEDAGRGCPRHPHRARRAGRSGRDERRGAAAEAGLRPCRPMWSSASWR